MSLPASNPRKRRYAFARSFGYGRYRSLLYAIYGARWQT